MDTSFLEIGEKIMKNNKQKYAAKMLATKIVNDKTTAEVVITRSEAGVDLVIDCQPEENLIMYVMLQRAIEEDNYMTKREFKRATRHARKLIDKLMEKED